MNKVFWFIIIGLSVILYQILASVFVDDFISMNEEAWKYEEFQFEGSDCNMLKRTVVPANGQMVIKLEKDHFGSKKRYNSGGISTKDYFNNGKISVRMKADLASGVIGSFVLVNQWKAIGWERKEISINFLGKNPMEVLFSLEKMPENAEPIAYNYIHTFKDSIQSRFHEYEIDWQDNLVQFFIDKQKVFETDKVYFDEPMNVKVILWAADKAENKYLYDWLGPVNEDQLPSAIFCDWIKIDRKPSLERIILPFKF